MTEPQAIVTEFNRGINNRDLTALRALMHENHRFIDSAGGEVIGRDACLDAWAGFFAAFPDYRNVFEFTRANDGGVAVRGRSECSDPRLAGPALWSARIQGDRIVEWRVYDDTPTNRAALGLAEHG